MSHQLNCPDRWEARREGQRDANFDWWRERPNQEKYDCDDAQREYERAFRSEREHQEDERRAEETAERRAAERRAEQRRYEEEDELEYYTEQCWSEPRPEEGGESES